MTTPYVRIDVAKSGRTAFRVQEYIASMGGENHGVWWRGSNQIVTTEEARRFCAALTAICDAVECQNE